MTPAVAPQRLLKASRRSVTPIQAPQGVGVWILDFQTRVFKCLEYIIFPGKGGCLNNWMV